MGYSEYLKELLRPLGVYALDGGIGGGELEAQGKALDRVSRALDLVEREMLLTTALDEGLDRVEELLPHRPVTGDPGRRRAALAALLRVGQGSATLEGINGTLAGCGLNALARETEEPGVVEVSFPDGPGIPDGFEDMRKIIEDILPCHLEIRYVYWYVTWARMEEQFPRWNGLEGSGLSWEELEKMVY